MTYAVFFIVILLTNIIQGITGFAGTILAMPPSIMLVGYSVAKPILNVLAIFSGVYVFMTHGRHVNWKELRKVVAVMIFGIAAGIFLKSLFVGKEGLLYKGLGIFVIALAVQGYYRQIRPKADRSEKAFCTDRKGTLQSYSLLAGAGIVHGMFVCGGPLLIGYLSKAVKDKVSFRATISTIWIILNTIILFDDIHAGFWNAELVKLTLIALPFLILGMAVGARLYKSMSQLLFMKLTYILLFISGITLLVK